MHANDCEKLVLLEVLIDLFKKQDIRNDVRLNRRLKFVAQRFRFISVLAISPCTI